MNIALIHDPIRNASKFDLEKSIINEHRNDISTGVKISLLNSNHKVAMIEANDDLISQLSSQELDIAFNISVGNIGENTQSYVPIVLERLGIPFIGSSSMSHVLALDKGIAKKIFVADEIDTPKFQVISDPKNAILNSNLRYPVFVKPSRGGCSFGITEDSVVNNENTLKLLVEKLINNYNQPILVEEYLGGREFTVGLVGNSNPLVLTILEIDFTKSHKTKFRTFNSKMVKNDGVKSICPAQISRPLIQKIQDLSIKAYKSLNCRDFARIDIRCDERNHPQILEINSLPGLAPGFGSFTRMAKAEGISYDDIIKLILGFACNRYGIQA